MSYGIEIKNEFGDNLVDLTAGKTFYRKSTGTSLLPTAVPTTYSDSNSHVRNLYPCTSDSFPTNGIQLHRSVAKWSPAWLYNEKISLATPSFQNVIFRDTTSGVSPANKTVYFPNPVSTNPDDLIFFKMPTEGIMSVSQTWLPFTGVDLNGASLSNGLFGQCCPYYTYTGTALDYQVVSTDLPATSSSNYGLVIYDEDGTTVLFDTTREVASFVDHISVTAAQAEDIIKNNTSLSFTLRRPVTNAWIAAEGAGGTSFRSTRGGTGVPEVTRCLRVQQITSTQIDISRAYIQAPTDLSYGARTDESYNDALFLIGDF